jgi:dolichyl-diphosphooligosaccharide--protein glycosyltransferase
MTTKATTPQMSTEADKKLGYTSLLTFAVLSLACVVGFASRLFAVVRFESIIHEFGNSFLPFLSNLSIFRSMVNTDSYILSFLFRFNYRSTEYMVENGFYDFLNWFDEKAWYPLGRIVGGTVKY